MSFPSERHEHLNVLVGTWDTTITMLDRDGADGEVTTATDTYFWMPNGQFLQHDVDAALAGERVRSMEIIAVDHDGHYVTRSYDANGTMNDFKAELNGKQWSLTGEVQRFTGMLSADEQILSGVWEQQEEGGSWAPLMRVVLKRRQASVT